MMFERTAPSAASTDAAVSSHDVSIPRMGPGIQVEVGWSTVVIMKSLAITRIGTEKNESFCARVQITWPLWPLAPQGPCRTLCDGVAQATGLRTLDASHGLLLDECRSTVAKHHADLSTFLEPSFDHLFGEWIADRTLNCPAHRSGSIERFIAFLNQPLLDVIIDLELHALVEETKVEFTQEDVENIVEMRLVQLMEDHDLVDPVQKLRTERAA